MKKISIISPVFDKVYNISEISEKIIEFFKDKYDFEVYFYCSATLPDDISQDHRFNFVKINGKQDFNKCVIDGFERVNGNCVIIADLNNPNFLDYITKLLVEWEAKAQIVLVKKSPSTSFFGKIKNFFAKLWQKSTNLLLGLSGLHADFYAYKNFQLFSEDVLQVIKSLPQKNYYLRNFDCWVDYRVSVLYSTEKIKVKNTTKVFTSNFIYSMISALLIALTGILVGLGSPHVEASGRPTFILLGVGLCVCLAVLSVFCFYRWFVHRKTLLEINMK